jgi:hypothetical protein
VRLSAVRPPPPESAAVAQLMPQYAQAWTEAETRAFYDALAQHFEVTLTLPPPRRP